MATLQERLDRMIADGQAAKTAVSGGGMAQPITPPSSAVQGKPTIQERLDRMIADGQTAKKAATPIMLPTVKKAVSATEEKPAVLPTPTVEGTRREVEELGEKIGRVKSQMGKTQQPYAMGRDTASASSPYAAGLQAKQAAEEQASPQGQLRAELSQLTAAQTKAKRTLFDLTKQATAENYEKTASHDDVLKGLAVDTTRSYLTGDAGDAAARVRALQAGAPMAGGSGKYGMYPQLEYLTEKQMETLLSLAGRGDWEGAGKYWKAIERGLNAQNQETQSQIVKGFAEEHPVAGAAVNVGAGFTQPLAYVANAGQAAKNAIKGEYEPTDPNSKWFIGTHVAQDAAEGVHAAAEKAGGGVGAFAADTALSVANMGAKMLTGPASLPLMGLSAAGDNAMDALERGATPGQALITSTAAGAAEILTEKLPVDDLFRMAKTAPKSAKEFVKNILKTMGSEGLQEAATEISNNLVDQMVMGGQSQYEIYVRELVSQGMNEQSARKAATQQFYLTNVGMAALGGAAAGGVMGGISQGIGYAQNRVQMREQISEQGGHHLALGTAQDMAQQVAEITGATQSAEAAAKSSQINVNPEIHTAEQQKAIEAYKTNTDSALRKIFETYLENPQQGFSRYNISPVTQQQASDAKRLLGGEYDGYTNAINSNGILHILNEHGPEGTVDRSLGDLNDISRLSYILEHYDDVEVVTYQSGETDFSKEFRTKDDRPAPMLKFSKRVDGTYYIIEAVPEAKHKKFWVVSAYMEKADGGTQAPDANGPRNTPDASLASSPSASDPIIPSSGDGVNTEYAPPSGKDAMPADGDWASLAQQADTLFPAPPKMDEQSWDGLLRQADAMYPAKGEETGQRENPFIPVRQAAEDTRTAREKALWEEAQRRKAAQPAADEPTYRMTPAMEKLGMEAPSRPITDAGAAESLRANSKALYEAKKQLDKVLRDTFADERARSVAKGIVDGIYTFEDAKAMGLNDKAIRDIVEAMYLVKVSNEKGIKEYQKRTNWAFDSEIKRLIYGSDTWTPPGVTSLNINTMQRNIERMMDPATAKAINAEFFDPIIENEAKRLRFVNNQLDKVRGFDLTAQESAMVQKVMEGKITDAELRGLGTRVETVYKAADTITQMYADFYDAINDFLVAHGYEEIGWQKNYAPHQQMENLTKLQKYLQRLGFSVEVTELPTEIAGRTDAFKPGKMFDPFFQHRAGGEGDIKYDAVGGLESYLNYMSNVLYHTDDIQKGRRLSEALRTKYADEYIRGELDRLNDLQDRIISGDTEGITWDDLQAQKEKFYEELDKKSKLGSFVSVLDDYINILAGKQSKLDRAVESMFGRKALNFGRNIQNAFARSAVMGNLSSAINQTVQLPMLTAEVGPQYVLQAIGDVASGKLGDFDKQSTFLTGKQGVKTVSAMEGMEVLYDKLSVPFELVDDVASRIIVRSKYLQQVAQGADHATALAAADQYANRLVGSRMKGAKPIVFEQKNPATKLVTTFQLEVANGWEHIVHDLPMEIQETARTKGKAAAVGQTVKLLVAGEIAAFLANCLIKSITGREPVPFDGIGMAVNYMAAGYGMTKEDYMKAVATGEELPEEFATADALSDAAEGIMDNVPFASNITTLLGITDGRLPLPQIEGKKIAGGAKSAWTALTSDDEAERKAAGAQVLPQLGGGLAGSAASFLPAGNQIKKTVKALPILGQGGAYSGSGEDKRLKYPVEKSPANWAKGLMFGTSALPESDAYYAEGKKTLTVNETKLYEGMVKNGSDGQKVYDVMQSMKGAKERKAKVDVLLGYEGTREEKEALFSGMVTDTLAEELPELAKLEVPFDTVLEAYKAQYGLEGDKDSKGNTVYLSASKNKKAAVDQVAHGLTRKQREAVYKAMGISEKVWSLPIGLPMKKR